MTAADATGRRSNKRGLATRESMLEAALEALASGDPAAASGNHIAKRIGATWGVVKYQFGDIDGLWAAVLHRTAERRGDFPVQVTGDASLHERVANIVDAMYAGLTAPDSRAIETLRAALPREHTELERLYPQTAAELASWKPRWNDACQKAFADLNLAPDRVHEIATLLPAAMRGIVSEKQLGTYSDLEEARRALVNTITAYLERP